MPHENEPLQPFNLDTMSGVYPGTRTPVYQRLRLRSAHSSRVEWAQLLWYRDPPSAVLMARGQDGAAQPLLHLPKDAAPAGMPAPLAEAVASTGRRLMACGMCAHWQVTPLTTDDGLPMGHCRWRPTAAPSDMDDAAAEPLGDLPDVLGLQSCLALDCAHFSARLGGETSTPDPAPAAAPDTEPEAAPPVRPRVANSAELDPDRLPFWQRQWQRLRTKVEGTPSPEEDPAHPILERSGVGAGTEPCFVCQERIANLGALAVESPEGDKQTLSVWRCRDCHTTYFNDWIDRWERLDSLETEETYYRIAPAEALTALNIIRSEAGGDHPAGRQQRHALRGRLLALVAQHEPLSHQVRQGR